VTSVALQSVRDAFWEALHVVVLDTETCKPPDGPRRVVAVATVTLRNGRKVGSWSTFVDPECPVDAGSARIHHITDDLLVGQPTFDQVAPTLVSALTPADGQHIVLVAHNVGFDVSTLRAEFARVGATLPDVAVLDTMSRLPAELGVEAPGRSLAALCATLGVVNDDPHDAAADARACADVLLALFDLAHRAGLDDIDQLRDLAGRSATTTSIKAARPGDRPDREIAETEVSETHLATHADVLSARVRAAGLARFAQQVRECADLRCPHLADRVAAAGPSDTRLLPVLEQLLADLAGEGDTAGAGTLLAAVTGLLHALPDDGTRTGQRRAALAWASRWAPQLDQLGRCDDDTCPACTVGEPCPLDTWRDALAPLVVGDLNNTARSTLRPNGAEAGTGTYTTWLGGGEDRQLADAALWLVVDHHQRTGTDGWADEVARHAWDLHCRDPRVVETHAVTRARPGQVADLDASLDIIDTALLDRDGSTADGWRSLLVRRAHLAGLRQRAVGRPTGKLDADNNPVLARIRHPATPRRAPRRRFPG